MSLPNSQQYVLGIAGILILGVLFMGIVPAFFMYKMKPVEGMSGQIKFGKAARLRKLLILLDLPALFIVNSNIWMFRALVLIQRIYLC